MNTNSLSVNSKNSLSKKEFLVTTKELAAVLNVGLTTVKDTVKKLSRVLGGVQKNKQGGYLFNEEQATLIKNEIKKHHNLKQNQPVPADDFMTIKQVAESLNVSRDLIEKRVKELFPNIIQKGRTTLLSEMHVTAIKLRISENSHLATSDNHRKLVDMPKTMIEKQLLIQQALQLSNEIIADLQQENKFLKSENNNLQIELDQSKEWYSIKRMEILNPEMSFNWRLLKKKSEELGYDRKDVFDANYGEVKAYHRKVWESLYFDSINYGD